MRDCLIRESDGGTRRRSLSGDLVTYVNPLTGPFAQSNGFRGARVPTLAASVR
jgi:hypothetical protein